MKSSNRFPRRFAVGAALAAGLLLSDAARAQDPPPRGEQGAPQDSARQVERRVEQLTQALQLSADQAAHVRRILAEEHEQLQARRRETEERETRPWWGADGGGARRRGPSPVPAVLRQRTDRQIERVLSDGQRARYRELRGDPGPPATGTRG